MIGLCYSVDPFNWSLLVQDIRELSRYPVLWQRP